MRQCVVCRDRFYDDDEYSDHMWYQEGWRHLCDTCPLPFRTEAACDQHMNATNHMKFDYPCPGMGCNLAFRCEDGLHDHMHEEGHYANHCKDCNRTFTNGNALRMHMNSSVHRGNNVNCPFCQNGFATASGLSHHLETGSCPKAASLNREKIHSIIRERDPHGTITKKQLTWHSEGGSTYSATDRAYNGRGWECYLCHREFQSQSGLNQHLNSPVHQQKVYHCPNRKCGKEFVSLAALLNHVESESCNYMRFEGVQKQVGSLISGNRLISF